MVITSTVGTLTNRAVAIPSNGAPSSATKVTDVAATASFATSMSGAEEAPPQNAADSGSLKMTIDLVTNSLCYDMTWSITSTMGGGPVTAATIQNAPAGVNGPVVINLGLGGVPLNAHVAGCVGAPHPVLEAIVIDPSQYYMNIHTTERPGGAIRGQLG